jgi:hypothetical protein
MGNNEIIEICMNDEIMEKNVSVQIKTSKNPKNEKEEEMKINLKKLHHKEKFNNYMEDYLYVGFFIVSMIIQILNIQIMCCILCYQELVIGINSKTRARKRIFFYYKTNGIISFEKHVDAQHIVIAKMFKEKINILLKGTEKRQLAKKIVIVLSASIFKFFSTKDSFKKNGVPLKNKIRRLGPFDY